MSWFNKCFVVLYYVSRHFDSNHKTLNEFTLVQYSTNISLKNFIPYINLSQIYNTKMSTSTVSPTTSSSALTDLLTWKDPIQTGKIFGSIIVGLVVFKSINLLTIFFRLSYIALLCMYTAG